MHQRLQTLLTSEKTLQASDHQYFGSTFGKNGDKLRGIDQTNMSNSYIATISSSLYFIRMNDWHFRNHKLAPPAPTPSIFLFSPQISRDKRARKTRGRRKRENYFLSLSTFYIVLLLLFYFILFFTNDCQSQNKG